MIKLFAKRLDFFGCKLIGMKSKLSILLHNELFVNMSLVLLVDTHCYAYFLSNLLNTCRSLFDKVILHI